MRRRSFPNRKLKGRPRLPGRGKLIAVYGISRTVSWASAGCRAAPTQGLTGGVRGFGKGDLRGAPLDVSFVRKTRHAPAIAKNSGHGCPYGQPEASACSIIGGSW